MTNIDLEKKIRAIVDNKPGISQKAIVQELKDEKSHNTVCYAIKSMAKAEELHEVKQGKHTMYFGPDKGEKFIEKSLEIDIDKIHKMLDDVKKKSGNSSYVHNRDTIKKLKNILPVIESIERHDEFLKIQLEPRTLDIDEKVESILKLLDGNLEHRQELTEIIHGIKTKLCELDCRRIEHLKELYNARSDGRCQSIEYDVEDIENVYESHYSELNNLELRFTSGKLSIQYIDELSKKYLANEPNTVEKIRSLMTEFPDARPKLGMPISKIIDEQTISIEAQKDLHLQLDEKKNELEYLKKTLAEEQAKVKKCEKLLKMILKHMKSEMNADKILSKIPTEYVKTT